LAAVHLSALARDLLHILDVLRLGRSRSRTGSISGHLCRPILVIGLCSPLIMRVVRLAKAQNITSIAGLHRGSLRQAQTVAAMVALIAIVGSIPYIALHSKRCSSSLTTILAHIGPASGAMQRARGYRALRRGSDGDFRRAVRHPSHRRHEHQDGLMLAIATESIVKLVAFVGVGVFVTFWMFDGPVALFTRALERPDTAAVLTREPAFGTFAAMTLLSLFPSCCCRGNST